MKKILITIGAFYPGYKIGGPATTISNIIKNFSSTGDYSFYIICRNHDWGDKELYKNIKFNTWLNRDNYKIMYVEDNKYNGRIFKTLGESFDIVYCTGIFSKVTLSAARYYKKDKRTKVIVAPMGSLFPNALSIKKIKKHLFLSAIKIAHRFDNVHWSVSSELEQKSVTDIFGAKSKCVIAEDLIDFSDAKLIEKKEKNNYLKIAFVSRIHPMKGLDRCFEILKLVSCNVHFDIYGIIEDEEYFSHCEKEFECIKNKHLISYKGPYHSSDITSILSFYDAFLFPTLSENFGHVIFESLKSSCIPIISNTTPWNDIKDFGAGYVFELNDYKSFASAIDYLHALSLKEINKIKKNCYLYAYKKHKENIEKSGYWELFEK